MPYLIDGHNLVGRTPGLRLDDPEDERKLIELLRDYLARARKKGTVVFDRGLPGGGGQWSSAALTVRFAPAPKTADQVIREQLQSQANPRGLTVVSSDQAVQRAARQAGAAVKEAHAFAREMLAGPALPSGKEKGLRPDEVAAWEEAFKKKPNSKGQK